MDIKISGEFSGIVEVLRKMAMFEMTIAELYSVCAITWEEDADFWLDIWRDEIRHAQYINRMIEIITKKPERFEKGRPFNVFSLQTTINDIKEKIEKIKKKELSRENMLFIAGDYENAYLEDRYVEIVKTDDLEYKTLMQKIAVETGKHKEKILKRIQESQKKELICQNE